MVVEARFSYLVLMAAAGHVVRIVTGHNLVTGKTKVKVLLEDAPDAVPLPLRQPTVAALEALRAAAAGCSVVDRGYRHSSGLSESHFWLAPLPPCAAGPAADRSSPDAPARTARAATVPEPAAAAEVTATVADAVPAVSETAEGPGAVPAWLLRDTGRLLRGCLRHQDEVQRRLLCVSSAELTDLELWTKTQVGYHARWEDVEIANIHRLLVDRDYDLLLKLQDWLGEDIFLKACRPPPS